MLKNKIDFIAKQCPVLHEYLDNLPSQHVSDVEEMGEKVKSFSSKIQNKTGVPTLITTIQHCSRSPSQNNKTRKRNKK
mgnify:CR=1 FL=1